MAVIEAMVRIYANLVNNGRRTIEQIPDIYKDAVKAEIAKVSVN